MIKDDTKDDDNRNTEMIYKRTSKNMSVKNSVFIKLISSDKIYKMINSLKYHTTLGTDTIKEEMLNKLIFVT
jgi:hypothetical protein